MRVLLLCAGLLALSSNLGCDAHLLGKVERGPCQAKNPFGRGFLDGTCMPLIKCKQTLRGIVRLNFPVVCGVELLSPIVCCPHMGPAPPRGGGGGGQGDFINPVNPFNVLDDIFKSIPGLGSGLGGPHVGTPGPFGPYGVNIPGVNSFEDYMRFLGIPHQGHGFGAIPGPYVPTIPHLPQGGSFGMPFNPQGNLPGPTHPQPFPPVDGGSGVPVKPDYPPAVNPQPPHGNSPGTGPVPPQPGSGGPAIPPIPDSKPGKKPVPGGAGGNPPEGGDHGAPCDKPECEPGENDSYIHLIDPRRGRN